MKLLIAIRTKAIIASTVALIFLAPYVFAAQQESPRTGGELVFCRGRHPAILRWSPRNHVCHAPSYRAAL